MNDIEIAKEHLDKRNLSVVVVKGGQVIFKSSEKGIKPIYKLSLERSMDLKGSSLADRVIGRGAAMMCKYLGVKEVYGLLMSETAVEVLNKAGIEFSYGEICPFIKNRDNTGLCPIEKISLDTDDVSVLLDRIGKFLSLK